MRAVAIDDFGSEPTVHELPAPLAGEGELLVRVAAASVNGFDLAVISGRVKAVMQYELPIVLGKDFAGTVEAVGPDVTGFSTGDEVFGVLMKPVLGSGTFADRVAVPAMFATKRPTPLDVATAGALGLAGAAAQAAVDAVAPTPGETVLVSGATGGVGCIAVQIAKATGAVVIATARADSAAFVRSLGADEVVDHSGDLAAAMQMIRPDGFDAVIHAAGDPVVLGGLLAAGGRMASTAGARADLFDDSDVILTRIAASPTAAILHELAARVLAGEVTVPIERTYSLDDTPQALADFTSGKRGKLAVSNR
jgi:NADPH:quinone reductase-like Zn-dependent oxidoreductase